MTMSQQEDEAAREAWAAGREDCATCMRRSVERQRLSLVTSTHWLAQFALASEREGFRELPDSPDIALCRAVPDCAGLACEAPFRRDPRSTDTLTADVSEAFLAMALNNPAWLGSLCSAALRRAGQSAHVPAATDPCLGPAAIHAAIVANNLLRAGWRGLDAPPSVRFDDALAASEPSLKSLELLVHPNESDGRGTAEGSGAERVFVPRSSRVQFPGGLDLLAIELLGMGLSQVAEFESAAAQSNRRQARAVAPVRLAWWKRLLKWLGLWPDRKTVQNGPARPVFQLSAESQAAWRRFACCDLLLQSRQGFAGTPLEDPARAALFLKNLRRNPDCDLVLPRICRGLVAARSGSDFLWLARVGARLLDDDGDNAGAAVSSMLLADLVASVRGAAMDGTLENSPLWAMLAAEGVEEEPEGGPRWIFRLCSRAAALQDSTSDTSRFKQLTLDRTLSAIRTFWAGPPRVAPSWQRFLLRCLELFLRFDSPHGPLPSGAGCGLARLATQALRIREALEQQGESASPELLQLIDRIWSLPRFPYWSRNTNVAIQSPVSPVGTFDLYFLQRFSAGRLAISSPPSPFGPSGGSPGHSGLGRTAAPKTGGGGAGAGAAVAVPTGKKKKKR
jgi:hypothetical protein